MARISLREALERTPDVDRAKLAATTEEDIRRYKIEDGYDPDADLLAGGQSVLPPMDVQDLYKIT